MRSGRSDEHGPRHASRGRALSLFRPLRLWVATKGRVQSVVINPYTFLPLGPAPSKRAPNGHHTLQARDTSPHLYSGSFTLTLTAETPLSLGPLVKGGQMPPRSADDEAVIIPGSSIAGALRSLHEAMNNSCMRIMDPGYRAVHREVITPQLSRRLRMAVVEHDTNGIPESVRLCDDVVWVPADRLGPSPNNTVPVTGDTYDLSTVATHAQFGRQIVNQGRGQIPFKQGSAWILLATDTSARPGHEVHFACGRPGTSVHKVSASAQRLFARAVDGTPDMRLAQAEADVRWPATVGKVIARRRVIQGLPKGSPCWVRVGGGEVAQIKPALGWRRTSPVTTKDRIPDHQPCSDRSPHDGSSSLPALCPSCAVFGSAGADEPKSERLPTRSQHAAYRGHIRVDDARAVEPPCIQQFQRAPLASPKPTAGQFYLTNTGNDGNTSATIPLAQWGSDADRSSVREVRGRKFYWRTQPTNHHGRFPGDGSRGLERQPNELTATVNLIEGKSRSHFTTRVTFDALTAAEIGGLIAAAEPAAVLTGDAEGKVVTSIGGGKPFGWGAVSTAISDFTAADAPRRYLGVPSSGPTVEECLTAYTESMAETPAAAAWTALGRVLTLNPQGVGDGDVWYPPKPGTRRDNPDHDEGFRFWQETVGVQVRTKRHPLQSLPLATDANQHLGYYPEGQR